MTTGPDPGPDPGICAACRHHRWTHNRRGSAFLLCEKATEDARFPKYPPLPVRACAGFDPHGKPDEPEPSA